MIFPYRQRAASLVTARGDASPSLSFASSTSGQSQPLPVEHPSQGTALTSRLTLLQLHHAQRSIGDEEGGVLFGLGGLASSGFGMDHSALGTNTTALAQSSPTITPYRLTLRSKARRVALLGTVPVPLGE